MASVRPSYDNDRFIVVIGSPGSIANEIIDLHLGLARQEGYMATTIYIHEGYFPSITNEQGIEEPDFAKIFDNHKVSEIERRLGPSSPNYVDPYSLVRKDIRGIFRNISPDEIHTVLFNGDTIAWADVEIEEIFNYGDVAIKVCDTSATDSDQCS